jgi:hypothetical protein
MVDGVMLSRICTGFISKKTSMECFKSLVATSAVFTFKIEENIPPDFSACLYVFKNGRCIRDSCQNTIQDCKEIALEMYDVPMDAWMECFKSLVATSEGFTLKIEGNVPPDFSACLYMFKNGKFIIIDYDQIDEYQDTIQDCKERALAVYCVPMDAWREEVKGDD